MFDDVQCDVMRCPLCGAEMGWQSKDGPCILETLTVHDLVDKANPAEFYADCEACRVWVEVRVSRQTGRSPAQWAQFQKEKQIIADRREMLRGTSGGSADGESLQDQTVLRGFLDFDPQNGYKPIEHDEDPGEET